MKKQILILSLMAICLFSAHAQLKVTSEGNVGINSLYPLSPLSLNCLGSSNQLFSYYCEGKKGLFGNVKNNSSGASFYLTPPNDGGYSTNLYVSTNTVSSTNEYSNNVGVFSHSSGASYNIGIFGVGDYTQPGAGIVGGTTLLIPPLSLFNNTYYAGFFYGDVRTTGNITIDGSIRGTLLGAAASASNNRETNVQRFSNNESMIALVSNLDAISYQYIYPEITRSQEEMDIPDFLEGKEMSEYLEQIDDEDKDVIKKQIKNKKHFGFDADQLELLFPDLVYEKEDGSKAVNYMEMIPLLVQSIKELKAELDEIKGADGNTRKAPQTSSMSNPITKQARLYQNTPNPFTAQTEIRFSLPDDATNASICIYDMTGKLLKKLPISSDFGSVTVNGYELGEGIYLYSLVVNGQEVDTRRMILSK